MIEIRGWNGEMVKMTSEFVCQFWHMKEGAEKWSIDVPGWSPLIDTLLDLMRAGF